MMGGGAVGHFGAVDDTTKRLIGRCIEVPWLNEETSESQGGSRVVNNAKQRLLSVSQPRAMESSLSVMEVAAQTSKPGEQTPSLRKEEEEAKSSGNGSAGGPAVKGKPVRPANVPLEAPKLDSAGSDETRPRLETAVQSPFEVEAADGDSEAYDTPRSHG